MGARVGFVYKTEDDLIDTTTSWAGRSAPTPSRSRSSTSVWTAFAAPPTIGNLTHVRRPDRGMQAALPDDAICDEQRREFGRYKTVEASINKRYGNKWSASFGFGYTWLHDFPKAYPNTPNQPGAEDRTAWGFKASGSYDAPYGIRISPILRHQSGVNFARTGPSRAPARAAVSGGTRPAGHRRPRPTIYLEPANANREDNIWVFDTRVEKTFKFARNLQIPRVRRSVQHHQQPRVRDDRPRDRHQLSEADADSRAENRCGSASA